MDTKAHTIIVHLFEDMVECVEFLCNGEVIRTLVGDGNIQMDDCPNCHRDFTTAGAGEGKVILSPSVPSQALEAPVEAR